MLNDDLAVKRSHAPHRGSREIGAREAERILKVSRSVLLRLAQTRQLPGRFIDIARAGRRRWSFKVSDVLRLRDAGKALRIKPRLRRLRVAWVRMFGEIPHGFTVISRDGNAGNTEPGNLALAPLKTTIRARRYRFRKRKKTPPHRWTAEQRSILRKEFSTRPTSELAKQFGTSVLSVRCKARRMRLRKSPIYLREQARRGRRQPIGTERCYTYEKNAGIVYVKVSNEGLQREQWRPKHHVVWEAANGKSVPAGFRVVFKDGNKRNLDPENLALATRGEIFSKAIAKFLTYPPPLRDAIRLTRTLSREVASQRLGRQTGIGKPKRYRVGVKLVRWTPAMDALLRREYADTPTRELAATLRVSLLSLRCRARRLALNRSPESLIREAAAKAAVEKARALEDGNKHAHHH